MFARNARQYRSSNLWAAAISVSLSAILFAYAIIPASPALIA